MSGDREEIPLASLLDARQANLLKRNGMTTASDLPAVLEDLLDIERFGDSSLRCLADALPAGCAAPVRNVPRVNAALSGAEAEVLGLALYCAVTADPAGFAEWMQARGARWGKWESGILQRIAESLYCAITGKG